MFCVICFTGHVLSYMCYRLCFVLHFTGHVLSYTFYEINCMESCTACTTNASFAQKDSLISYYIVTKKCHDVWLMHFTEDLTLHCCIDFWQGCMVQISWNVELHWAYYSPTSLSRALMLVFTMHSYTYKILQMHLQICIDLYTCISYDSFISLITSYCRKVPVSLFCS